MREDVVKCERDLRLLVVRARSLARHFVEFWRAHTHTHTETSRMYLEGPEAFARGVVFMDVVYMVQSLGNVSNL